MPEKFASDDTCLVDRVPPIGWPVFQPRFLFSVFIDSSRGSVIGGRNCPHSVSSILASTPKPDATPDLDTCICEGSSLVTNAILFLAF